MFCFTCSSLWQLNSVSFLLGCIRLSLFTIYSKYSIHNTILRPPSEKNCYCLSKLKELIINTSNKPHTPSIHGKTVEQVNNFKYLGLTINKSFDQHITFILIPEKLFSLCVNSKLSVAHPVVAPTKAYFNPWCCIVFPASSPC